METKKLPPSAAPQGGGREATRPLWYFFLAIFGRFFVLFHRAEGLFAGGSGGAAAPLGEYDYLPTRVYNPGQNNKTKKKPNKGEYVKKEESQEEELLLEEVVLSKKKLEMNFY